MIRPDGRRERAPGDSRDAEELARIQGPSGPRVHGDALPDDLLEAVGSAEAADRWRSAIAEPPSPRHRVLTALDGDRLVGFAALAPASDPDTDPARTASC